MSDAARNLSQVVAVELDSTSQAQEQMPISPWQRQPGESPLWYNRFKLYRDLGYKRTIQAALEKERATAKVLESTGNSEKPGVKKAKAQKSIKKRSVLSLAEVPKPAPVQVPGSWKQASIKYHWVERCAAYDEHRIDSMVDSCIDDLMEGAATSFHRVLMLKQLLENLRLVLNASGTRMSFEQYCMWMQRMQSIMKQIADEMSTYNEALTRVIMRKQSEQVYRDYDGNKAMKQAETEIKEATPDERQKMIDEIDQEMRRRRLR